MAKTVVYVTYDGDHGQSALDLLGDPPATTGWYYRITPNDYASRVLIKAR